MAERKNDIYRDSLASLSEKDLLPRVKETLLRLRKRGLKLAIGSSSKNAPYILERIGLGDFFDAVASGGDITRSKPDPEVFLIAADRADTPPVRCAVVEDAKAGIDAARAGGFFSVAIGDAFGYPLADASMNSINKLPDIVLEMDRSS